jgi:hypothetical protein
MVAPRSIDDVAMSIPLSTNASSRNEVSLRRALAAVLTLGIVGVAAELLLLEHDEDWVQIIPLATLGMGLAAMIAHGVWHRAASVRAIRVVMLMFIGAGLAGIILHYRSNAEFQAEIDPSLTGFALFRESIRAKVPPALAPGAMVQLGLVGLAFAYRHPLTRRAREALSNHGGSHEDLR